MFERLREILKSKNPTAAEVQAELAQLDTERPAAAARLADLRDKRRSLLLTGTDKEQSAARAAVMAGEDALEAIDLALETLRARLADAEARERRAALEAKIAAASRASDRGLELVRKYETLADEMVRTLAELQQTERTVRESWPASLELGVDKVAAPLRRAVGDGSQYTEIAEVVRLVAVAGSRKMLWPPSDPAQQEAVEEIQRKLRAVS